MILPFNTQFCIRHTSASTGSQKVNTKNFNSALILNQYISVHTVLTPVNSHLDLLGFKVSNQRKMKMWQRIS